MFLQKFRSSHVVVVYYAGSVGNWEMDRVPPDPRFASLEQSSLAGPQARLRRSCFLARTGAHRLGPLCPCLMHMSLCCDVCLNFDVRHAIPSPVG